MTRKISLPVLALALICAGLVVPLAAAQGGTIQDLGARLSYGPGHWDTTGETHLAGTLPASTSPLVVGDVLEQTGWWIRVDGDTREHRLGPPSGEVWGPSNKATISWNNWRGLGLNLEESLEVADLEGPSGRLSSRLFVFVPVQPVSTVTFQLFYLLDGNPAGNNLAVPFAESARVGTHGNQVRVTAGAARTLDLQVLPNGGPAPVRVQCGGRAAMLALLEDGDADDLDGSGLSGPAALDGVACIVQATVSIVPNFNGAVSAYARVASNLPEGFAPGDADNDLAADLNLVAPDGSSMVWLMRHGLKVENRQTAYGLSSSWRRLALNDFNNDGGQDLVAQSSVVPGVNRTAFRLSGVSELVGVPGFQPASLQLAATADFDRDGQVDILWRDVSTQRLLIWRLNGTTRAGDLVPEPAEAVDGNWQVVGAADMNNDGFKDLLWYNVTSGRAVIWYLDSQLRRMTAGFTDPPAAGDATWKLVAIGDFGKGTAPGAVGRPPDLVWRNDTSGRLVVWFMDWTGRRTSGAFASAEPDDSTLGLRLFAPR